MKIADETIPNLGQDNGEFPNFQILKFVHKLHHKLLETRFQPTLQANNRDSRNNGNFSIRLNYSPSPKTSAS